MKRYMVPVLTWLWGAVLASAWWGAVTLPEGGVLVPFVLTAFFGSIATVVGVIALVSIHWDD